MYKLEFTLKQHTPLIHFQHNQEGATLRASEVKPKLDWYLREAFMQIRPDIYKKFCDLIALLPDSSKEENKSSPYKLVIQPVNVGTIEKYVIASYIPKPNLIEYEKRGLRILDKTPYFADNNPIKKGALDEAKLGVMLKKDSSLKLIFRYFNSRWGDLLNEALPLFFASTNFGSRQSKGFGCFLPANLTKRELENLLKEIFPVCFRSKQFRDLKETFAGIDSVYKNLKSGDRNHDSELRKYFNDFRPVVEWEKPAIQEKVAEISGLNLKIKSKTNNRQFVRALLGLPEIFEYPKHGGIKAQVRFEGSDTDNEEHIKIERYGSPLLFRAFDNIVFMVVNTDKHSNIMLDKAFDFEFSHQGRKYGKLEGGIKTPPKFDLVDFLKKGMKEQPNWLKI